MSKEIFDSYIESTFEDRQQSSYKLNQFRVNYDKYFPSKNDANLLDIGIGRGEMITLMKNHSSAKYIGIDISPSTVNFCRSLNLNCSLVENTEKWLEMNHGKFDLITLLDVLEHIPRENTIHFLKSIKDALTPDGTVIIQVPNLQARDGQIHHFNDFTHVCGYVEHSLKQVLIVAGFKRFHFFGFEEFVAGNLKEAVKKFLRFFYWKYVRFTRAITGTGNPKILHPVMYVVAKK